MTSQCNHPLLRQLSICGQVAEHKSGNVREHGGDEAMILASLSAEQQAQLSSLLDTLQNAWLQDHAQHHKG